MNIHATQLLQFLGTELLWLKKILISSLLSFAYALLIYIQPALGNAIIFILIWAIGIFMVVPVNTRTIAIVIMALAALMSYYELGFFSVIARASYLPAIGWKIFTIVTLLVILGIGRYLFKLNLILLGVIFASVIVLAPLTEITWNSVLKNYHRERILTFVNQEESDPTAEGYQVRQSIIAIGSGQIVGRGFLQGSQSTLKVLPFAHTDFIFAALAEQFGFLGISVLFTLYALLLYRIIRIYLTTTDAFAKLLVMGCSSIMVLNIFINVAMNMGLIPVTGVPLPLISYGGSSVMVMMISLGLIQMVQTSIRSRELSKKIAWKMH